MLQQENTLRWMDGWIFLASKLASRKARESNVHTWFSLHRPATLVVVIILAGCDTRRGCGSFEVYTWAHVSSPDSQWRIDTLCYYY